MRFVIAFLLVACVMANGMYVEEDKSEAMDFLTGFLQGIGENGNVNDLEKCVKNIESAIEEIKAALELLKNFNLKKLLEALPKLIHAVKTILNGLTPCMESFQTLKKLVQAMAHPDIKKIALKIMTHAGEFIGYVTSAIGGFKNKDFKAAGKGVGNILRLMFLSSEEELRSNAVDFMKGFIEGIGEKGDIEKLLKCLKDLESIFNKIKEALNELKHINLQNLIKGLTMLFSAVRELMEMIKPCSEGFETIKKLIQAIAHPDIKKIAMKILMHSGQFIGHVTEAIKCFGTQNYHCAGKAVGSLLKIIFL